MTTTSRAPDITRLDVRAALASGEEPFDLILTAARHVPRRGVLELTAPFEPMPLYPVMRRRGFARATEVRGPTEWVVRFRETGITPTATLATVAEEHPATREVFGKHALDLCCGGGKTLEIAARAHGLDLDLLLEELQASADG